MENPEMTKRMTEIHDFVCTECGNIIPLPRRLRENKAEGHVKHVYCFKCKTKTKHIEKYR
jgi:hypothetical protein